MDTKLVLAGSVLAALCVLATAGGDGGGHHKVVLEIPTHIKENKHIHTVYKIVKVPSKKEKRSHEDHHHTAKVEHSGKFEHQHLHKHQHDHNGEIRTAPLRHFHDHNHGGHIQHNYEGHVSHGHSGGVGHEHHGGVKHYHDGKVGHEHHGGVKHHHDGKVGHGHHGSVGHNHGGKVGHGHQGSVGHNHGGKVGHGHHGSVGHGHGGEVGHGHHGSVGHGHGGKVGHGHHGSVGHGHGGEVGHGHGGHTSHSHSGNVGHHHSGGASHGGGSNGGGSHGGGSHGGGSHGGHYTDAEDSLGYYSELEPDHEASEALINIGGPSAYTIGSSGQRITSFKPHEAKALNSYDASGLGASAEDDLPASGRTYSLASENSGGIPYGKISGGLDTTASQSGVVSSPSYFSPLSATSGIGVEATRNSFAKAIASASQLQGDDIAVAIGDASLLSPEAGAYQYRVYENPGY